MPSLAAEVLAALRENQRRLDLPEVTAVFERLAAGERVPEAEIDSAYSVLILAARATLVALKSRRRTA